MLRNDKKLNVIIRTIAFVLVFISIFVFIEAVSYDGVYVFQGWHYVYEDEIDVLIMGSSLARCSFDAKLITEQTGKSTVILSSGAQNIQQTYYNLLEVLKYQKPDLIVVESLSVIEDTLKWMGDNDVNGLALENLDGMKMSPLKYWAAFQTLGFDGYGVFHIMREAGKTERLASAVKHIKARIRKLINPPTRTVDESRGFGIFSEPYAIGEDKYNESLKNNIDYDFEIIKENLKYMDKVIEVCLKNNIDIEFIKTPMVKNINSNSGHQLMLEHIDDKDYPISAYNLMDSKYNLDLNINDYSDLNHLSITGVYKVSEWFVKHLDEYYSN